MQAAVCQDNAQSAKEVKRAEFIATLRQHIAAIKDAQQRQQKMIAVKGMLEQRADHLLQVAGMNKTDVKGIN